MEKVVISLLRGRRWRLVGLSVKNEESLEELKNLIEVVQESIKKNFYRVEIVRRNAIRELLGE